MLLPLSSTWMLCHSHYAPIVREQAAGCHIGLHQNGGFCTCEVWQWVLTLSLTPCDDLNHFKTTSILFPLQGGRPFPLPDNHLSIFRPATSTCPFSVSCHTALVKYYAYLKSCNPGNNITPSPMGIGLESRATVPWSPSLQMAANIRIAYCMMDKNESFCLF